MERLQSGLYQLQTQRKVTVWPKPDPDGDGEPLYRDVIDAQGNFLGRDIVMTDDGREVRTYLPPPGFTNVPSRDTGADGIPDNYVRDNGRGGAARNIHGHAVSIKPGTALVEYPDGTHELLSTDYAQVLFGKAHDRTGDLPEEGKK